MNLHDWIDELCDVLNLKTEVDEGLLNDLAKVSYDQVDHLAGPVTTYLLGFAAGANEAGPATVERLAAKAQQLAESWDRPADEAVADDEGSTSRSTTPTSTWPTTTKTRTTSEGGRR